MLNAKIIYQLHTFAANVLHYYRRHNSGAELTIANPCLGNSAGF